MQAVQERTPEQKTAVAFLRKLEEEINKKWEIEKPFEANAPKAGEAVPPKYFVTFPYPYMNGTLHLGHTFTVSKAEFGAGYQRMKGKRTLFPFGFHCTGMPIKASADKLKREMAEFGCPPKFPPPPVEETTEEHEEEDDSDEDDEQSTEHHAKRGKAQSKAGKTVYQWETLKEMGVAEGEIPRFADAAYWLKYFPPRVQADLQRMGASIDWRRSFLTTDVNPYYDSFVRWQFNTMQDLGKLKFGKRISIYSPRDGQPCADHDRKSDCERVMPLEYTLIKQELLKPFPAKLASLETKKVFLVPATLRPETMYGQTNCFVLPEGDYGAYETKTGEVLICCEHAARNLSYQGFTSEFGKVVCLGEFKGSDLIGAKLSAPLAPYPVIYVLPMQSIDMQKGTGVVTSVPSDSPEDYICLTELQRDAALRQQHGLKDEMVLPFNSVPVVDVPDYGTLSAKKVCEYLSISGSHERKKLRQAKKKVYLKGFYTGVMVQGEHKGKKVTEARTLIRKDLIKAGHAIKYSEPARPVISRSGDVCVCALTDQWYITYKDEAWKNQVREHLKTMDTFAPETRHLMEHTLGWLKDWPCSRTYGLGTRLPFNEQYMIEALSDSTIYMAFYTVAHLLQKTPDGSQPGLAGVRPEELTREVWDYIFFDREVPKNTKIPVETLNQLRSEFRYWYPVDMRVSGKDLVPNHLTFWLYNHCLFWPNELCPRGVRANGHMKLRGKKMSKSEGNFLTMAEAMDLYSVCGMRFALACAGDAIDDSDFTDPTAHAASAQLIKTYNWIEQTLPLLEESGSSETSAKPSFSERMFENRINQLILLTEGHYERMKFREVIQSGFFDLYAARDRYIQNLGKEKMNAALIRKFIEVQLLLLSPICPHFCDTIWRNLLRKPGSILNAPFPVAGPVSETLFAQEKYLADLLHKLHQRVETLTERQKMVPESGYIYVAQEYPEWVKHVTEVMKMLYEKSGKSFSADYKKTISEEIKKKVDAKKVKKEMGKMMGLVVLIEEKVEAEGEKGFELDIVQFDEKSFVEEEKEFIRKQLNLKTLSVHEIREENLPDPDGKKDAAMPGNPTFGIQGRKK